MHTSRSPVVPELGRDLHRVVPGRFNTVPYVSEKFYEAERSIWNDAWVVAARAADLVEVGSFITLDLQVVPAGIFVIRSDDGKLRGFRNLCTHRGCRLLSAEENRGTTRRIRCRFHAWLFDTCGRLRNIPHHEHFPHVNKEELGLLPVSIAEWGGFVFCNLSPAPRYTLQEWLAGMPDALGVLLQREKWEWYAGYSAICDANWKELLHGVHDGYHAGALHANSTPGARWFRPENLRNSVYPDSPGVSSLLSVSQPEPPAGTAESSLLSPVQRLGLQYTGRTLFTRSAPGGPDPYEGAANPLGKSTWVFDMWTIFPNLVLVVMRDVLFVFRYFPLGPHRTLWDYSFFYRGACTRFSQVFCRELGVVDVRNLLPEDMMVSREVHANLRSGALGYSPVATDMEACIMDFYRKILDKTGVTEQALNEYR